MFGRNVVFVKWWIYTDLVKRQRRLPSGSSAEIRACLQPVIRDLGVKGERRGCSYEWTFSLPSFSIHCPTPFSDFQEPCSWVLNPLPPLHWGSLVWIKDYRVSPYVTSSVDLPTPTHTLNKHRCEKTYSKSHLFILKPRYHHWTLSTKTQQCCDCKALAGKWWEVLCGPHHILWLRLLSS